MSKLLEAIAVTAELTGTELTRSGLLAMEADLGEYPVARVLQALARCRRELTGRLTLAAVVQRLDADDGRPGSDEAWAAALTSQDEQATVVWTSETAAAYAIASPIIEAGDKVGARMAFRDAYERIVRQARDAGDMPRWQVSLGLDPEARAKAVQQAAQAGQLSHEQADKVLAQIAAPPSSDAGPVAGLLTGNVIEHPAIARHRLAEVRRAIAKGDAGRRDREYQRLAEAKAEKLREEDRRAELLAQAQEGAPDAG